MPRVLKHLASAAFVTLVAGCAAGGGGCSGITPLPSGFKVEDRIENAGSVRLTESGVTFLEQNLGVLARGVLGGGDSNGGVITFGIPSASGSALVGYTVCPGGADPAASPPRCTAEIDVAQANLQIEPRAPHNLRVRGQLPLRLQNLPILVDYGILGEDTPIATLNGNGACPPNNQTFANIDLDVELSIAVDVNQSHARRGYSRITIESLQINEDQIGSNLHLGCGDSVTGDILNFLKPIILPLITGPLLDTVRGEIERQLCQQANTNSNPPCPDGTNNIDGICRYGTQASAECASILLGFEGHLDLGQLLAGISPGTKGGFDILLAGGGEGKRDDGSDFAWGDLNPASNGLTLGLYGGAEPVPVSGCVPLSEIEPPRGIPMPDEVMVNTVPGWPADVPGPHASVAISERFVNYALNGAYNSGVLCLGLSTATVPALNSGLLGLFASSSKFLALQSEPQQVAFVIRPQSPPQVTFGNGSDIESDPLIRLKLDQASIDMYVWSLDRFIRFMTATFDLDVPANLTVTPEGLVPVIQTIGVKNPKVTNSTLLREDPQALALSLANLIGSQVGQLLGGNIPPLDLNGALSGLGISLIIPESVDGQASPGLRRLTKGEDRYLGIFATLAVPSPQQLRSETSAELRYKKVQPEGLSLLTMTEDNAPTAELVMSSSLDDGTRAIEYSYRIDRGPWRPYARQRIVELSDDWLRLQGRHEISVRSRIAGDARSLDPTPASVELLVDVAPPVISVGVESGGTVPIEVRDQVSGEERAKVRVRLDGGAWSAWTAAAEARVVDIGDAAEIEVEAIDEEGNLGTARQAILRGRAPGDGSGCGCEVAGGTSGGPAGGWLLGLAIAAIGARLGRRRAQATSSSSGRPLARRARQAAAGVAVVALTGSYAGCSCSEEPTVASQCAAPDCVTLDYGLIGAYTSVAVDRGTVWIAGYAEADWANGYSWGDLAVGMWNGTSVDWAAVDGVPLDPPVDPARFNTKGFRGGQTEAGDDVGLWTSIAVGPDGEPAVAYHDRTNRSLKFAQKQGATWLVSSVQQAPNSDIGRYAKLLFVNGVPVIAYLAIEPGEEGAVTSGVRLATAESAIPGEGEWRFEDVATDKATPCRAHLCASGTSCIRSTGRCTKPLESSACDPRCGTGSACVDASGTAACAETFDSNWLDTYPDALGGYISMAPDGEGGFGLAFYDRIHGNVMIASKATGRWESQIIDGETPDGVDTGDRGMGASLFIDVEGDWHLAYADGYSESLRYARVRGGTESLPSEQVDDGLGIGGTPFEDGQHFVGDDSRLFVTPAGEVRISYQDATAGTLRLAIGARSGDGHTWQVKAIEQEGFAGAFSQIFELNDRLLLANWWRLGGQRAQGDVAILSP